MEDQKKKDKESNIQYVEHFIVRFINFMKKSVLTWSILINVVLAGYIIFTNVVTFPSVKKEYLMEGFDFCHKAEGNILDKYYQSVIPLKIYNDCYWKARLWFDDETKDKYGTPTLLPHERNSEKVKALSNSISMKEIEKIRNVYQPIWPCNYFTITSKYGWRNMSSKDRIYHPGIDISMEIGNSIFATDSGIVILSAYNYRDYGTCIMIQHPYNVISVYGHLSRKLVKVGDSIKKGEVIALSGNSGVSTGSHLHFELRYNNKIDIEHDTTFNPLLLIG